LDQRIGTEIAGYRIEQLVGRGGMGVVYLAQHLRLERRVALKLLAPELVGRPGFRERFIRESRLAASIDHPNILPIYDAGEEGDVLYISMRYVQGTDLKTLLEREARLEPEASVAIVSDVASALDAAHARDLVHRDVKPGNILIAGAEGSGDIGHVYLSDFGLTKRTSSDSGITATGQFVGTLDYAAPEQFEGRSLDARTDEYSLACVLFECLTGSVPYPKEGDAAVMYAHLLGPVSSILEWRPELPPELDAVVAKAMSKDPDARYATAGEFARTARDAIGVASREHSDLARPTKEALFRSRPPRSRAVMAVVAAAILVAAIASFLFLRGGGKPSVLATNRGSVSRRGRLIRISPLTTKVAPAIEVGGDPSGVAAERGAVWITDASAGTVTRVDPSTNKVVRVIRVGAAPKAIALGEGGVWVANSGDGTVSRIDPATNTMVATIPVRHGVDLLAVGNGMVIAGVSGQGGLRARIDPSRNEVVETVPATISDLVSGDGEFWYAEYHTPLSETVLWRALLYRIADNFKGVIAGTLYNTSCFGICNPPKVAVGDGTAWATLPIANGLRSMNTTTGRTSDFILVGHRPVALALDGIGSVWVLNQGDGSVWKISAATGRPIAVIPVGQNARKIAVAPDGVWVIVGPAQATP
jgi:YVTN family beta-propeller protein